MQLKLNAFQLKLIAIIGMSIQHFVWIVNPNIPNELKEILMGFGGLTFIIMAYFLVEGYKYTRNLKKYMLRMLIFALISMYPFYYGFQMKYFIGVGSQNVLFTLLLGLVLMYLKDNIKSRILFILIFIFTVLLSVLFDWAVIGIFTIYALYAIKDEKLRIIVAGIIAFIPALLTMGYFAIGILISVVLLLNYSGSRGRRIKYLFYIFYPLHIMIFGLIRDYLITN